MHASILRLAQKVKTPWQMQQELFRWSYNRRDTLYSARKAIEKREAHCMEAAMAAAAVLEHHGYPPIVMSFESQDGLDHVIYVFKEQGRFGSIGRSRDEGLHGREPRFRNLRELALSYIPPYVDKSGRIKAYEVFHLDETGHDWRESRRDVWPVETHLLKSKHLTLNCSDQTYTRLHRTYLRRGPMPRRPDWWSPPRSEKITAV